MKNSAYLLLLLCGGLTGCWDVFEKDISDQTVSVIAPVNGVETTPGTITFLWDPVSYAEGYRLRVVSPDFARAARVLADSLVAGTTFSLELEAGSYQWSIQAWNFGYSGVRSVYSLQIIEPPEPEEEPDEEPEPEPGEKE